MRSRCFVACSLVLLLSSAFAVPCFGADKPILWDAERFTTDAGTLHNLASEASVSAGADVLVMLDEEDYVFDSDGRVAHSRYLVYKVLTQGGANAWDNISLRWEPWHEERPQIRARVISADASVHWLDAKTISDAPANDDEEEIYSDRRVVRAPLPAVAPGAIVEEEVFGKEGAVLPGAGFVARYLVGRSAPVQHTRLVLDAPSSLPLRYELELLLDLQPQRAEHEGRTRLVFDVGPREGFGDAESNLPSDVPANPHINFSTGTSWQRLAEAYGKVVDEKISGSSVKSSVNSLIAKNGSREDKIAALMRYLNREIRYTGVEFGESAIVPHTPDETLSRKYGDCKDKSTLLVAMLRAAGIPAYLALLNAGSRQDIPQQLPGMGLFDHAIVYVPGPPDFWIDATDRYSRLGQLPAADQGRMALAIRPESDSLIGTPVTSSQENLLLERREIHLAENGPARIVEVSEPHGTLEPEYRSAYVDKENKDRNKSLTDYVKWVYLAEKLDEIDRSDPSDSSKQFELTLTMNRAKRGFTDLESAVAAIRLDTLFSRLPNELREREKTDDRDSGDGAGKKKKRTADWQLRDAFATEWYYTIYPPAGFRPKPLPANLKASLGPAILSSEFSTDPAGVVHAVVRFDTVKRRFSATEAAEMRNAVAQRWRQVILVNFEPLGEVLLREGKVRESLQSYRDLIALHPKEAVHHLQFANVALKAGMGGTAREEARLAVKLEPSSALAYKTLAEVLEYDLVGRKFRRGSDFDGAEAAFRAAQKLDPEDSAIVGNLAILLEYNHDGERYGRGAKLKESVAEYRRLTPEQLTNIGLQNNPAYTLLYAGEFEEARKYADTLPKPITTVIVAAEAASKGSDAGIAEANRRLSGSESIQETLKTAGQMLMRLRKYPEAAGLLQAGASGNTASNTMGMASLLRKARPHETEQFGDDPLGLMLQLFVAIMDDQLSLTKIRGWSSRNAEIVLKDTDPDELQKTLNAGKNLRDTFLQTNLSVDALIDLVIQAVETRVDGDDTGGYRVKLRASGKTMTAFIVKENGKYKILDSAEKPNAVGLEILDRISAGDLAGARRLLDWIREDQHLEGEDDPLVGHAFPRMWTKGMEANADRMKLAAAAILVQTKPTAPKGIALLEPAREQAKDTEKLNMSLALLSGYEQVRNYEKLLGVSSELATQYPDSKRAFFAREFALRSLKRYGEADGLAQDRLKRIPDDLEATRSLVRNAVSREDYALAHDLSKKIVATGKGEAWDLNSIAWYAIFTGGIQNDDIEAGIKATQSSQYRPSELHTLGTVYAEIGKTKEAREVLIQAMDKLFLDEPDSNYWYTFGRIAEQYGETTAAIADYERVKEPKDSMAVPGSTYLLAQRRLAVLRKR